MNRFLPLLALSALTLTVFAGGEAKIVRDIPYDPSIGENGLGDLHYPENWTAETPVILVIHGGGWTGLHRPSVEGKARFLTEELGMASFNIEYRLAGPHRWPACGDDCVKAAKWLLSPEFAAKYGLKPKKIWITGGSAGGHLVLWTALSLPADKVKGAIAVSPIGDPRADFAKHAGRYFPLFGHKATEADLGAMDPCALAKPGQAPILFTHADIDAVVPIASSRAFEKAYRAAGNRCDFFEYAHDCEPNEGGHYIWRPKSKPHKLLACLEERIIAFIREFEPEPPKPEPKKIFSCSFDGTVKAELAGGDPNPQPKSRNHRFVPGRRGQALEMKRGCGSALAYLTKGNMNLKRGTVAFWFKPDPAAQAEGGAQERRFFVCTTTASPRAGSGTLWFWQYGSRLRGDQSDDGDRYVVGARISDRTDWTHVAYTWGERGVRIYVDGRAVSTPRDSASLLAAAFKNKRQSGCSFSRRQDFEKFFVGGYGGSAYMDGAMDDLEVWSGPLEAERVAELFKAAGGKPSRTAEPDYVAKYAKDGANPFTGAPLARAGVPGELELIDRWTLDAEPTDTNRFKAVGSLRVGELGGVKYLETGTKRNDRFALRFDLGERHPLYCFEIDYPDDRVRTMDLVVQNALQTKWDGAEGADYTLQVGVAAGDEYPNSNRILTHRCLYWPRGNDIALMVAAARPDAPAAVSEVRVYRVRSGRLPEAKIAAPEANEAGWRRSFALYFEDPAIGYDFDVQGGKPGRIGDMIDRVAALMKYTGQNLMCYPGAWYAGVIGDDYMPREHARGYRKAYYAKFDREGLGFMPTINQNNMAVPEDMVDWGKIVRGELHSTPFSIWETGMPNPGGWHGTPPNFNIAHPDVQKMLEDEIDLFVSEGVGHPSFKGVVLHLTRHCLCWFGDIRAGYNDYCIDAFVRAKGVRIPGTVDRKAAMRGKAYAEWINGDPAVYEKWLDWRCETVAAFYRRLAAKLKAARSDLKLVVNSFLLPDFRHVEFPHERFIPEANRRAGLDARLLEGVDNISVCQTEIPADYRFFGPKPGRYDKATVEANEPVQRGLYFKRGDYGLLEGATWPWVNQHDRYFENSCGTGKKAWSSPSAGETLSSPWLRECSWRVTTINPAGRHALKHFAVPLRHHDVMTMSKGGFLIGTYGMEDLLVPWMQAFRALPAVRMTDCGGDDLVKVRTARFRGKTYFYAVNTDGVPRSTRVAFPKGTVDAVTGEPVSAQAQLDLQAYELRSFVR